MKEKERVDNWWSSVINNFIYFYRKCLQVSLMNSIFFIFRDLSPENDFSGHHLLFLKLFLVICLSKHPD